MVTTRVERFLPGVRVARSYRLGWLGPDLLAGIGLTALLVPQGMAYAELAGLPPVTVLYTTIAALFAYAVFGPSRVLVLGPDSALGPLIAAALVPLLGGNDPSRAIALAAMLALLMGALSIVAGFARLGVLTELLSKPVRIGFLNGIALVVLVGQLPHLFGFSTDAQGLVDEARAFVEGVTDGQTVPAGPPGGARQPGGHRRVPLDRAESARRARRRRRRRRGHRALRPHSAWPGPSSMRSVCRDSNAVVSTCHRCTSSRCRDARPITLAALEWSRRRDLNPWPAHYE